MRKLGMILVCLFALSAPVFARQSASNFSSNDCPFQMPDGESDGTITCGTLTVPEDHNAPDGTQIKLAVAVIHSDSDTPAPDPILYLSGGPGDSALAEVADWANYPFRDKRDIILLDQRGTGYSDPALKCPGGTDSSDEVQTCHDQFSSQNVNWSDYNSLQSAADVADLRQALGYQSWNIIGISYGTRLALVVMRDHPEGIRSVIIDSVYPPQVNDWEEEGTDTTNAYNNIFKGCAADADCNQAYPDLENVFYQTVAKLNAAPAADSNGTVSGDDFAQGIFMALYSTENIPYIPQVIYAASQGDLKPFEDLKSGALTDNSSSHVVKQSADDPTAADGDFDAVTCSEEIPFDNFDKAMADAQATRPELRDSTVASVQGMWDACKILGVKPGPAIESQPVSSDLPTLVLEGDYDPVTPVAWGKMAAQTLSNSFFFQFPGLGHGTIDSDCPMSIIRGFLDDPTTQPDSSCIADMTEPKFVTSSS